MISSAVMATAMGTETMRLMPIPTMARLAISANMKTKESIARIVAMASRHVRGKTHRQREGCRASSSAWIGMRRMHSARPGRAGPS